VADRDRVDAERTASQEAYSTVETRLSQVRSDRGYRSERLKIVDPGIVPEQPSSPNVALRLLAALMLGLVVPVVYLTLELSYRTQRAVGQAVGQASRPVQSLRPTGTVDD